MTNFQATILKVAIHRTTDNPIYGDVTYIALEDEAAGPFLILSQSDAKGLNEIRLMLEELEKLAVVAKNMMEQYPNHD